MGTLLERARGLIAERPAVLGALVIVPLAMAAREADALAALNPYTFGSGSAFLHSTSGDFAVPATLGAVAGNPLRLHSGGPISVTGSTYDNAGQGSVLRLLWQGQLDAATYFPVNASAIAIHYDFTVGLGGTNRGSVNWSLHNVIGGQTLDASSSSALTAASTQVTGDLFLPVTSPLSNTWSTQLELSWAGYTGDGLLTIDVPSSSSIDLGVVAVPEPASLAVMGLGTMGLLLRRRRKS
jgi:hypothetical protein